MAKSPRPHPAHPSRVQRTSRLSSERPNVQYGTKRSEERYVVILEALSAGGSIRRACEAAGISRDSFLDWRKDDLDFDKRCKNAIEEGIDKLEDEAFRRAHDGVEKGVYHQGVRVDTEIHYSDALLQTLLRANRPKFRTSALEVSGPGGGPQEHDVNISPRELLASRIAGIVDRRGESGGSGGSDGEAG